MLSTERMTRRDLSLAVYALLSLEAQRRLESSGACLELTVVDASNYPKHLSAADERRRLERFQELAAAYDRQVEADATACSEAMNRMVTWLRADSLKRARVYLREMLRDVAEYDRDLSLWGRRQLARLQARKAELEREQREDVALLVYLTVEEVLRWESAQYATRYQPTEEDHLRGYDLPDPDAVYDGEGAQLQALVKDWSLPQSRVTQRPLGGEWVQVRTEGRALQLVG